MEGTSSEQSGAADNAKQNEPQEQQVDADAQAAAAKFAQDKTDQALKEEASAKAAAEAEKQAAAEREEAEAKVAAEAEKVRQAKEAEEAKRAAQEARRAEEWRMTKLRMLGQPVYYRSGGPHQDGHEGTTLHAGIVTELHDDWSADLTVFPKRAGIYHVERAPLGRVEDPDDCGPGCYRPRE